MLRPLNMLLFFAGVALGAVLAAGSEAFAGSNGPRVAMTMLSAALIGGAANAINDVYDLAIDRINRPARPLPAERVTLQAARRLWAVLTVLGVLLGFVVSPLHGGIALGAAGLLWLYSARLKRTPGWGNVVVAFILFLAIGYGGLAARPTALGIVLIGATFAFLTTLAREGAKDIEDAVGDAAEGARTLPLVWGLRPTARAVLGVIGVTLLMLPVLPMLGLKEAFLGYALPAAFALLGAAWALLTAGGQASDAIWYRGAARASGWLKAAMVFGVVALALARLG